MVHRPGIHTRRGLTQSEVACLLNGQRAAGEEVRGRTKRAGHHMASTGALLFSFITAAVQIPGKILERDWFR